MLCQSSLSRVPLLAVRAQDLGREVWRLDFADEPMLLVNPRVVAKKQLVQSVEFQSLVLPEILRSILNRILLVEQDATLGGNHTWSFYHPDLTLAQHAWIKPLVVQQWPAYEVRFPTHKRILSTPCYSISSTRFHEVLIQDLGKIVMLNAQVSDLTYNSVRVNGTLLQAQLIIDGRGHEASDCMRYAYQKFVGLEVLLTEPHTQTVPIIMDACVAQTDGYRFVYTLPLDNQRILIEDTRYSNTSNLLPDELKKDIVRYAESRGWHIKSIVREESGVLPIALSGDIERFWDDKCTHGQVDPLPCSGLRAALFHPTTGYSFLYAVRLAERIAKLPTLNTVNVYRLTREFSTQQWRQTRFMRALNRMLFFASAPERRYLLLQRFYRLPQPLIERFYAGMPNWNDKLRIMSGKPPVPLLAAFKAVFRSNPA